jgi:hypothetical protein
LGISDLSAGMGDLIPDGILSAKRHCSSRPSRLVLAGTRKSKTCVLRRW